MNVLDLSVFPCMSRWHIAEGRSRGGLQVLTENDIWQTTLSVWEQLLNAKIASGFVQAHQIAVEVIKANGVMHSLVLVGPPHVGVRKDFHETSNRLYRKDGKVFGPP
jgi:hypothetical protein